MTQEHGQVDQQHQYRRLTAVDRIDNPRPFSFPLTAWRAASTERTETGDSSAQYAYVYGDNHTFERTETGTRYGEPFSITPEDSSHTSDSIGESYNYSYDRDVTKTIDSGGTVGITGTGSGTGSATGWASHHYQATEEYYDFMDWHREDQTTTDTTEDYSYHDGWEQTYSTGATDESTWASNTATGSVSLFTQTAQAAPATATHTMTTDTFSDSYSETLSSPGFVQDAYYYRNNGGHGLVKSPFATGGPTLGYQSGTPDTTPVGNTPNHTLPPVGNTSAPVKLDKPEQVPVCFARGTLVLLANGSSKAIETIQAGDMVLAAPENDPEAKPKACRVVEVYHNDPRPLLEVHAGGQSIRCTFRHPFYVKGKGWIAAERLKTGDQLRTPSGEWLQVESIADTRTTEPVFNMTVDQDHTYFVVREGVAVLVHNDSTVSNGAVPSLVLQPGRVPNSNELALIQRMMDLHRELSKKQQQDEFSKNLSMFIDSYRNAIRFLRQDDERLALVTTALSIWAFDSEKYTAAADKGSPLSIYGYSTLPADSFTTCNFFVAESLILSSGAYVGKESLRGNWWPTAANDWAELSVGGSLGNRARKRGPDEIARMGDILVVPRSDDSGHVGIYLGNGLYISASSEGYGQRVGIVIKPLPKERYVFITYIFLTVP